MDTRHRAHVEGSWAAFLGDVCRLSNLSPPDGERAAVAVLRVLEQRLPPAQARKLEAELPSKLRQLLHPDGILPPFARFGREQLERRVAEQLGLAPDAAARVLCAVLAAVRMHLSDGEREHVAGSLPPDLKALWQHPTMQSAN